MNCKICPMFSGGICPLCECGLTPMAGLNPDIVFELALFLSAGSLDDGQLADEGVLGHAIRKVRESRRTLPALRLDLEEPLPPTMREPSLRPEST